MADHGKEVVVHSQGKCFTATGRGPTKLKRLNNKKGERIKVTYNSRGQPIGDGKNALASYVGVLVKYNIPITYHNWAKVPKTIKKDLWNSIQHKFEVDPKTEKEVIMSMAKSWRCFKGQLTRFHINPNRDKPELLKYPPPKYKKMICQSVWEEFVRGRLSEDFLRTSRLQCERRAKCVYNHRTSKKGYVGLEEELKQKMGPSYKEDKTLLWLKARQNKNGEYVDDATKEIAEKIVALKKQVEDGKIAPEENIDILSIALGQPEKTGQSKKQVKSKEYLNELEYKLDEERRKRKEAELLLQDLQAQFDEFQTNPTSSKEFGLSDDESGNSDLLRLSANASGNSGFLKPSADGSGNSEFLKPSADGSGNSDSLRPTAANAPRSWGGSKSRTHNLKFKADERAKTHNQISNPVCHLFKGNGYGKIQNQDSQPISVIGKFEGDPQTQTQKQVSDPTSNIGKGQKCKLAIGSKTKIVAEGMFFKRDGPDEIIHNILYGENNVRVSITKVFSPYAILPVPVPNEMETVKDALGSFVIWPKKFVLFDIEEEKDEDSSSDIPIKESEALLDLQGSFGSSSKFKGDDDKMKAPQISQTYKRKGKRGRPAIGSKTLVSTPEVKDVENEGGDRISKTRRVSKPVSNKRRGRKRKVTDIIAEEVDTEEQNDDDDDDDGYGQNGENTAVIDAQNWENGALINVQTAKMGALIDSRSGEYGALIDAQSGENSAPADAQSGENSALVDAFALTLQTMEIIEIRIPLEKEIFGEDNVECYIFKNNLLGFCALKALDATCIAAYIRHLYDKHESSCEIVKFFNPASVSATSKLGISRLITKRLQNAKANQIYFIPYHIQSKSHWVLIVIDCSSMNIFWLDSSSGKPDEQTKFYINTGLNSVLIDGKRRLPTWNINTCPRQEGNVQCGYYVMKFMSELMDDPSISIGTKMKKISKKETYTIEEINEVRIEFMEFVIEHLGDV